MLCARTAFEDEHFAVADVDCRHPPGGWSEPEPVRQAAVVLIRRGQFRRWVDGAEASLDPTTGYCQHPGTTQRVSHPLMGGDRCTVIRLTPNLIASIGAGVPELPRQPLSPDLDLDLAHRLLLADLPRGQRDGDRLTERVVCLVGRLIAAADPERLSGSRASAARARRLAREAKEALAADPTLRVIELAALLSASPFQLSRTFTRAHGQSVSQHRASLRARLAMERLAEGEPNLARLAADLGYADHAHLTRSLRRTTGLTPSALRLRLTAA